MNITDRLELIDTQVGSPGTTVPSPYILCGHSPKEIIVAFQRRGIVIDPQASSYTFSYPFGVGRQNAELPLWMSLPRKLLHPVHFWRYRLQSPSGLLVVLSEYSDALIDDPRVVGGSNTYKDGIVVDLSYTGHSYEEGGKQITDAKNAISQLYSSLPIELAQELRRARPPRRSGGRLMEPWKAQG